MENIIPFAVGAITGAAIMFVTLFFVVYSYLDEVTKSSKLLTSMYHEMSYTAAKAEDELRQVRKALRAYPDSDLVSLAEAYAARIDTLDKI